MAELVLRIRDRELNRVGITKSRMTMGRDAASDLVIDNAGVSRLHATVLYEQGSYKVKDEGSENGITVNGKRVRKAVLEYGDLIAIGKFEIELAPSDHEPYEDAPERPKPAVGNVMKTMRMDPATVARLRDEAIARAAAQRGLPPPEPRTLQHAPAAAPAAAPVRRAPAAAGPAPSAVYPQAQVSSGMSTPKLIGIIVVSVLAGGGLVMLLR